jgi:hypothetical protein
MSPGLRLFLGTAPDERRDSCLATCGTDIVAADVAERSEAVLAAVK